MRSWYWPPCVTRKLRTMTWSPAQVRRTAGGLLSVADARCAAPHPVRQVSTTPSAAPVARVTPASAGASVPRASVPPSRAPAPPPRAPAPPARAAHSGASGAQPAPPPPLEESLPAEPDDIAADLLRDWRAPSAPQPVSGPPAPPLNGSESAVPLSEHSPPRPAAELRGGARQFVPQWAPAPPPAASLDESMEDGDDEYVDGTPPEKRAKIGWAR